MPYKVIPVETSLFKSVRKKGQELENLLNGMEDRGWKLENVVYESNSSSTKMRSFLVFHQDGSSEDPFL